MTWASGYNENMKLGVLLFLLFWAPSLGWAAQHGWPPICDEVAKKLHLDPLTFDDVSHKARVVAIAYDTDDRKKRRIYPFSAMAYLSSNPWDAARTAPGKAIAKDFIFEKETPLTNENITLRTREEFEQDKITQCCQLAESHFWTSSLWDHKEDVGKEFIAISVEGTEGIVGIQKFSGDKTFLATKTVLGPDGKPVLLKGGIYELPAKERDRLFSQFRNHVLPSGKHGYNTLKNLEVLPRRMINSNAYSFPDQIIERTLGRKRSENEFFSQEEHRLLMQEFHRVLDSFTKTVESGLAPND